MRDVVTGPHTGLPLTGERTVPGIAQENYWFRRHEVAYQQLREHCAGAVVLEAGCGEGYGAALLAEVAGRVLALDYDELAARHAGRRYPEVDVLRANLAALPLGPATVDVVANLQVIEHLWDQPGFVAECARVLRPGGLLLITTPNRITFSPGLDTPLNPFHTRELDARELAQLLREAGLRVRRMAGVHHGPRLRAMDEQHGGSLIQAQVAVALAGDQWPAGLLADVASVSAADFEVHTDEIDASLDLLAVAVKA